VRHNHSIIACSRHTYMGVGLRAYPIRGESNIQRNANGEVVTTSPPFTTNRTFFLWRLHLARPSHPSHSTILLRLESPSSKCTKLHTVAASNNRDHALQSLYYCLFTPHIYGCWSSRTSCSWWITYSTQQY